MPKALPAAFLHNARSLAGTGPYYLAVVTHRRRGEITYSMPGESISGSTQWLLDVGGLDEGGGLQTAFGGSRAGRFRLTFRGRDQDGHHFEDVVTSDSPENASVVLKKYYTRGLPVASELHTVRTGIIDGGGVKNADGSWSFDCRTQEDVYLADMLPPNVAKRSEFSLAPAESLGQALPYVIGQCEGVPPILLKASPQTKLMRLIGPEHTEILIEDGSDFRGTHGTLVGNLAAGAVDEFETTLTVDSDTATRLSDAELTGDFFIEIESDDSSNFDNIWVRDVNGTSLTGCVRGLFGLNAEPFSGGEDFTIFYIAKVGDENVSYTEMVGPDLTAGGYWLRGCTRYDYQHAHEPGETVTDPFFEHRWMVADHECSDLDPEDIQQKDQTTGINAPLAGTWDIETAASDFPSGRTTCTVGMKGRLFRRWSVPSSTHIDGITPTVKTFNVAATTTPGGTDIDPEGCWDNEANLIDLDGADPDYTTFGRFVEAPTWIPLNADAKGVESGLYDSNYIGYPFVQYDINSVSAVEDTESQWANIANVIPPATVTDFATQTFSPGDTAAGGTLRLRRATNVDSFLWDGATTRAQKVYLAVLWNNLDQSLNAAVNWNNASGTLGKFLSSHEVSPGLSLIDITDEQAWTSQIHFSRFIRVWMNPYCGEGTWDLHALWLHVIYDPRAFDVGPGAPIRHLRLQYNGAGIAGATFAGLRARVDQGYKSDSYSRTSPKVGYNSLTPDRSFFRFGEDEGMWLANLTDATDWSVAVNANKPIYISPGMGYQTGGAVHPRDFSLIFYTDDFYWTDEWSAIDGDSTTYACYDGDGDGIAQTLGLAMDDINAPSASAEIKRVWIYVDHEGDAGLSTYRVALAASTAEATGPPSLWHNLTKGAARTEEIVEITGDNTSWDWSADFASHYVYIECEDSGGAGDTAKIYNVRVLVEYWDPDTDLRSLQLVCDVDGAVDSAFGTWTGSSGSLIRNPADVIAYLLNGPGTTPLADIDTTSWTAARAARTDWKCDGALTEQQDSRSVVNRIAWQHMLRVVQGGPPFKIKAFPATGAWTAGDTANTNRHITDSEIIDGQVSIARQDIKDIVNAPTVLYDLDPVDSTGRVLRPFATTTGRPEAYALTPFRIQRPGRLQHAPRKQADYSTNADAIESNDRYGAWYPMTISLDFVRQTATAALWLAEFLRWWAYIRWRVTVTTDQFSEGIEEWDLVSVAHREIPQAPGAEGAFMYDPEHRERIIRHGPLPDMMALPCLVSSVQKRGDLITLELLSLEPCA